MTRASFREAGGSDLRYRSGGTPIMARPLMGLLGMMTILKSEPTPSDREVLTGLVERVTYQNAENGFCVVRVKARGHRELVTLVGHAPAISAGEWITATGNWVS